MSVFSKEEQLAFFAKLIQTHTGIVYSDVNFFQLWARLENLALENQFKSVEELFIQLKNGKADPKLINTIVDQATNNETSFFRDDRVFEALAKTIIPQLRATKRGGKISVWCCATSTGQEPYSVAMLFHENAGHAVSNDYEIFCTDISTRVLDRAKAGEYTKLEVSRGLSEKRLGQFFLTNSQKSDGMMYTVRPELRQNLSFSALNLIDNWVMHRTFDLVLCRNVLIYQTVDMKKKIMAKIYKQMNPDAYLILGGAESLVGLSDDFVQESIDNATIYRPRAKNLMRA